MTQKQQVTPGKEKAFFSLQTMTENDRGFTASGRRKERKRHFHRGVRKKRGWKKPQVHFFQVQKAAKDLVRFGDAC